MVSVLKLGVPGTRNWWSIRVPGSPAQNTLVDSPGMHLGRLKKNPPAPSPDGCSGRLRSFSARICLTDSLSREFCNPYGRSKSKSIQIHSDPSWHILEVPILGSDFWTFSVQFFVNFWGCFLLLFRVCEALSDELWETAFLKDLPIKMLILFNNTVQETL